MAKICVFDWSQLTSASAWTYKNWCVKKNSNHSKICVLAFLFYFLTILSHFYKKVRLTHTVFSSRVAIISHPSHPEWKVLWCCLINALFLEQVLGVAGQFWALPIISHDMNIMCACLASGTHSLQVLLKTALFHWTRSQFENHLYQTDQVLLQNERLEKSLSRHAAVPIFSEYHRSEAR